MFQDTTPLPVPADGFQRDSVIQHDGGLLEGIATFVVVSVLETQSRKTGYLMEVVELQIKNEKGTNTIKEYFVLGPGGEWKLCQFFKCIGHRKHGEPLKMNWDIVPGCTGKCKVTVEKYHKDDGSTGQSNKVQEYLAPTESVDPVLHIPSGNPATTAQAQIPQVPLTPSQLPPQSPPQTNDALNIPEALL